MREIEIERLVQWAYRDELPKRGIGDVANDWERVSRYGELLTVIDDDPGFPVIMGPPHPDALTIERAVQGLHAELQLDWDQYRMLIMGDMPQLAPRTSPLRRKVAERQREATVKVALCLSDGAQARFDREPVEAQHFVFSEVALVEAMARAGRRPEWDIGTPRPRRIIGGNNRPTIVGESKGDGRYTYGSYCPLQYVDPSIEQLAFRRAEYLVWRGALDRLVGVLRAWLLTDHVPLEAEAPAYPWLDRAAPMAQARQPTQGMTPWRTWADEKPKRRQRASRSRRSA